MAKLGKSLFALAALGAAAAGAYYYMQKKNSDIPANMDDEDEDMDFDSDVVDAETTAKTKRSYVNLDFNTVEEKAKGFAGKAAGFAAKAGDSISNFFSQAEGKVEEFFDDRKNASCDVVDEAAEAVAEEASEVADAAEEVVETVTEVTE